MIQIGLVSAILPDLSLRQIGDFGGEIGLECVEAMTWPADSPKTHKYCSVQHVDVDAPVSKIKDDIAYIESRGVKLSSIGIYSNKPNLLTEGNEPFIRHVKKMMELAPQIGLTMVTGFAGRDWTKSVEANWPTLIEVFNELMAVADANGVKFGLENCPMFFSKDEWPGGTNIATSPRIWRRLFNDVKSPNLGLNYDPSHMVWQHMDYIKPIKEFKDRIFHVHIKDTYIDEDKLNDVGIMATPLEYHVPKLPGLGSIDWGKFFAVLTDVGYEGPACIEVEDPAFQEDLQSRKIAINQSLQYVRQFMLNRSTKA
jgi:sugar phosphate isomerase/epimerase